MISETAFNIFLTAYPSGYDKPLCRFGSYGLIYRHHQPVAIIFTENMTAYMASIMAFSVALGRMALVHFAGSGL